MSPFLSTWHISFSDSFHGLSEGICLSVGYFASTSGILKRLPESRRIHVNGMVGQSVDFLCVCLGQSNSPGGRRERERERTFGWNL